MVRSLKLAARQAAETFAASVDGEASEHSAAGRRGSGLSMAREAVDSVSCAFQTMNRIRMSNSTSVWDGSFGKVGTQTCSIYWKLYLMQLSMKLRCD